MVVSTWTRIVYFLILLSFLWLSQDSRANSVRKKALIINNWHYTTQWPPLKTPKADGEAIAQILQSQFGFEVEQAHNLTFQQFGTIFQKYIEESQPNEQLIIYYGGHGQWSNQRPQTEGFWLPINATSHPDTWISNQQVNDWLLQLRSRQVLLIVNSCYSGAFLDQAPAIVTYSTPSQLYLDSSRWVISSSALFPSEDVGDTHYSPFTAALLNVLDQEFSADQIVSVHQLGLLLTTNYYREAVAGPLLEKYIRSGSDIFLIPKQYTPPPSRDSSSHRQPPLNGKKSNEGTTPVSFQEYAHFFNQQNYRCGKFSCLAPSSPLNAQTSDTIDSNRQNVPIQGVTWHGALSYCLAQNKRLPYFHEMMEQRPQNLFKNEWTLTPMKAEGLPLEIMTSPSKDIAHFQKTIQQYLEATTKIPTIKIVQKKGMSQHRLATDGKGMGFRCVNF